MEITEKVIESFDKNIEFERVLTEIHGHKGSPTIIIIAGIHGNEKAGIYALQKVIQKIDNEKIKFNGNFYAISGNLNALQKNIRYDKLDLNRIWTSEHIESIHSSQNGFNKEIKEQLEIYNIIKTILKKEKGPFYFIDLHTTSSDTIPFITISDSLNNRNFSSNFKIPIVLGIEEFLDGPLLTFINEFGHMALGFEGGQHDDSNSIDNCEAFIWLSLVYTGCIKKDFVKEFKLFKRRLSAFSKRQEFFEIDYRYLISGNEDFKMDEGFKNFDPIAKGQLLASSDSQEITSSMNGRILMPLYQKKGSEGFFIITKISKFWLNASIVFRKLKLHHLLRLLPGVRKDPANSFTLQVNPRTAKFLRKEIFHLFGYRKQVIKDNKLHFIKRDRKITQFK